MTETQRQQSGQKQEPRYTQRELEAAAAAYGIYPWDVAGVFKLSRVDEMSEAEFKAALERWRAPLG